MLPSLVSLQTFGPRPARKVLQGFTRFLSNAAQQARKNDRIVFKFGGSSVGTAAAIAHSCRLAKETAGRGEVCVVVSAMYGVTNKLVAACEAAAKGDMAGVALLRQEIRDHHFVTVDELAEMDMGAASTPEKLAALKLELDSILEQYFDPSVAKIAQHREMRGNWLATASSLGERLSVPLVAYGISRLGPASKAVYTDKLVVTDANGDVVNDVTRERLQFQLVPMMQQGVVPVVSGFIAGAEDGSLSTLGRGGSDLTSTLLADAVGANEVQLCKVECNKLPNGFMKSWSSVAEQTRWTGIRSGCPDTVGLAHMVGGMSFEEAAELAHYGKKVLHRATMEPVKKSNTRLFIRNTSLPDLGTQIGGFGELSEERAMVVASIKLPQYLQLHAKSFNSSVMGRVAAWMLDQAEVRMGGLTMVAIIGANADNLQMQMHACLQLAGLSPIKMPAWFLGLSCSTAVLVPSDQAAEAQRRLHTRFVRAKFLDARTSQPSPTMATQLNHSMMILSGSLSGSLLDEPGHNMFRSHTGMAFSTLRSRTALTGRVPRAGAIRRGTRGLR